MLFFMLEAGTSTVVVLGTVGVADTGEHIRNGIGDMHSVISS